MGREISAQTLRVLAVFLEEPHAPQYGFGLARSAGLAGGTVYPILARLKATHLVESHWEDIDPSEAQRPPRRYYLLTPLGETVARRELEKTAAHLLPALGMRPTMDMS